MVLALVNVVMAPAHGGDKKKLRSTLYGSGNLLFLCVGLTGTMVLVNNNMVRAFAIGAAIALVRFRIKLDGKSANASLLFAILCGIACGLGGVSLAWTLLGAYVLLAVIVGGVIRMLTGAPAPNEAPERQVIDLDEYDGAVTVVMRGEDVQRVLSPRTPS